MAGSPKKRAKREAARLAALSTAGQASAQPLQEAAQPAGSNLPVISPLRGEILPPVDKSAESYELTRTALRRAMRQRAQGYAEKAIDVLEKNLNSVVPEVALRAANDLLKWGFGQPATEIEAGDGANGLQIAILKFKEAQDE